MPVVQQLARDGSSARTVLSVFPALTYPAHTSIVTGALPARHGIWHNRPFEPGGQSGRWLWEASAITAPTLWDAVHEAGGTTAAIAWPVTVGASAITWNVPDVWPLDFGDGMAPIRAAMTPPELIAELEREATGRLRDENFSISRLVREDRVGAIAAYLFERYRPTLLLVHCIGADHVQHLHGRETPLLRRALGAVDRAIGQVLDTVERLGLRDRTTFIITGDHGSADVHTQLRPNVWLAAAGLMEPRADRGRWRATFLASGGSAFLELCDAEDAEAVTLVERILAAQPSRIRALLRVVDRTELTRLGADPVSPLALVAMPGIELHESAEGPALRPAVGAAHGYLPTTPAMHTGFVAAGAGVRPGIIAPELRLEDIAPLVATLLGLDFTAPDGVLMPGLILPRGRAP